MNSLLCKLLLPIATSGAFSAFLPRPCVKVFCVPNVLHSDSFKASTKFFYNVVLTSLSLYQAVGILRELTWSSFYLWLQAQCLMQRRHSVNIFWMTCPQWVTQLTKKAKIPFVHITVYIHFFVVLIQLSFGLKRSSFYLFIVHHFFRFGQSFSPDKMVFFYLLFKSLSLFSKEYFASSNCIISNMYYPAINFFIQVINNNSGQDILHDIYLLLLRIAVIPSLVLLTGLQTPQERHHSSLIFIFP